MRFDCGCISKEVQENNVTIQIQHARVKAVQEPGYTNFWWIQDEAGNVVARLTVNNEAEAWAKRIEAALNDELPRNPN